MTTKDQERKALEQIRKIVAGLGEDSYVATAFEGCFEIAEQNIEFDFGCSMQQRAESAEEKLEAAGIIRSNLEREIEDLRNSIHELNTKLAIANNARLSPEQKTDIQLVLLKRIDALDCAIEAAEKTIINYSDEPGDIAFKNAVRDRKAAKEERDKLWRLNVSLEEME